jgi:ABC-type transport system involved in multi-copper enzyme maturation permease subunit
MKTLHILFHIARADFRERTRRYSFLVMLGLVLYLGYTVNAGKITLRLDSYRGIFNSAWVGSMMTMVINFFLGWFGFYLVKNAIERDYETGVGQIMATTPLSRPTYTLGKWLSNFAVLGVMVFILTLAAVVMQMVQREAPQIELWALIAPLLFVALPYMALTAAIAVLFESVRWLRGGFGNLVYFFFFVTALSMLTIMVGPKVPLLDWIGLGLFSKSMGDAARAVYPDYQHGFSLGVMPSVAMKTFYWPGVKWTLPVILTRMMTLVIAIGTALLGSLFFDRFDPSRERPSSAGKDSVPDSPEPVYVPEVRPARTSLLTPLSTSRSHFRFGTLLLAEMRMLLRGLRWWWYVIAFGLIGASLLAPLHIVRNGLLPALWIWPILLWSGLGCRESRYDTGQMIFSASNPMRNQLPATWLAGFLVTALMGSGVLVRYILAGETASLPGWFSGVLFVPSLALALGTLTGSSKAFEVLYVLWMYLIIQKISPLDFIGMSPQSPWYIYAPLALALGAVAAIARKLQLQSG